MGLGLGSIVDAIGKSAGQVKSSGQTASSLVTTGAKDSMVAIDGYGKESQTVLSTMKNNILGQLSNVKSYLLNTQIADLGSLDDALKQASQVKDSATQYASQLSGAINRSIGTVKGISDELINTATSTLQEINNTVDSTFSDINGIGTTINNAGDIFQVNSLISSVNTLLNSADMTFNNLEDKLSMSALKSSIIQQASYLGLSNVVDTVYKSDRDDVTLTTAMGDSLSGALSSGNLELIETMVDNLGGVYVLQKQPDAIQVVLQNYRFTRVVSPNEYSALADKLISVLVKIDPRWNSADGTNRTHRLNVFRNISSNAKTLLMTKPEYQYQITVVGNYSDTDLVSVAKQQYTYIAIA